MSNQPFDVRIQQFHQSLPDGVRHGVGVFMKKHGAHNYYNEMVAHEDPSEDPGQREMDAVMCGLMVYQHVPKDAWEGEFAQLVGDDFYKEFLGAVQEALEKFDLGDIKP